MATYFIAPQVVPPSQQQYFFPDILKKCNSTNQHNVLKGIWDIDNEWVFICLTKNNAKWQCKIVSLKESKLLILSAIYFCDFSSSKPKKTFETERTISNE
jgi:hypothetical protein